MNMTASRNYWVVLLSVISVLSMAPHARAVGALSASGSAAVIADDDGLEAQIAAALKKDSMLAPRDIDVEVKNGRVTLTGTVRTAAEKARAAQLAKVSGVVGVTNKIDVDPNIDKSKIDTAANKTKSGLNKAVDASAKAARKTKEGVEKGVESSEKGVGKAAGKTSDAIGKAGDELNDASITTQVKSKLSDEASLKDTAIQVETSNHVVTLKGTVRSSAAKARAGAIAAGTAGVNGIVNELVVTP
jgi:osmotically-inducible protein OsmY